MPNTNRRGTGGKMNQPKAQPTNKSGGAKSLPAGSSNRKSVHNPPKGKTR